MEFNDVEPAGQDNHEWLLRSFAARLLEHAPQSVLDVGCGSGLLLRSCREQGIDTIGLDQPGPRLDALRDEGLDVREGTAYSMPFEDRSVDWVTLRHVPHHLEDPARAVAEALRVARRGLIVAEPWFDTSVASQRSAIAVDRWEKRQQRRGGMVHDEVLDLGALLATLPLGYENEFEVEVQYHLRLRSRSVEEFEREATTLMSDLPEPHAERSALAELLVELEHHGLTWNGSMSVVLSRTRARP